MLPPHEVREHMAGCVFLLSLGESLSKIESRFSALIQR